MIEILIALVSAAMAGFSTSVQKLALSRIKKVRARTLLASKLWLFSTSILLFSFVVYLFALEKGQVSLIQPIINSSFVFTVICSYFILGERITRREVFSLVTILTGIIFLAVG